jgi:hypothetical protein
LRRDAANSEIFMRLLIHGALKGVARSARDSPFAQLGFDLEAFART